VVRTLSTKRGAPSFSVTSSNGETVTGMRCAVVGAGVAGLAVAHELAIVLSAVVVAVSASLLMFGHGGANAAQPPTVPSVR
jgi:ribulose 1,5-bisphosphate synthetase/thiazole synthase